MRFKSLFLVSMILVTATFARAAERDLTPATKCSAETVEHACSRGLRPALSLRFEANLGQTDKPVKFLSRGSGFGLFLTNQGAVLRLAQPKPSTVRIALTGQSSKTRIEGIDRHQGRSIRGPGEDTCDLVPSTSARTASTRRCGTSSGKPRGRLASTDSCVTSAVACKAGCGSSPTPARGSRPATGPTTRWPMA